MIGEKGSSKCMNITIIPLLFLKREHRSGHAHWLRVKKTSMIPYKRGRLDAVWLQHLHELLRGFTR
jgi:hypothetical protein